MVFKFRRLFIFLSLTLQSNSSLIDTILSPDDFSDYATDSYGTSYYNASPTVNIQFPCLDVLIQFLPPDFQQEISEILSEYGDLLSFICEDNPIKSISNVEEIKAKVNLTNDLFAKNLSNYASQVYWFDFLPQSQFAEKLLGALPKESAESPSILARRRKRATSQVLPECQNLPAYKNWVEEGKTAPVQNQGECGCCYIFSSTAVLESTVALEYSTNPLKLSAQHNLECVKNFTGEPTRDGCGGGRPEWIWKYAKDQKGIVKEESHTPYNNNPSPACESGKTRDARAEVDYWVDIPDGDEEAMKCRVAKYGPIHVSITVNDTSMKNYKAGIWDDPEGNCTAKKPIDHAVFLVGYGTEVSNTGENLDYWLVQNSWGTNWGINGLFKMKRGVNLCKIATDAMYPVLKTDTPKPLQPIFPPTGCTFSGDVYNTSGIYVKSFCSDNYGSQGYEAASLTCLQKQMRLYRFDSDEAKSTLLNAADEKWSDRYVFDQLYVSGMNDSGCSVIKNNPFPFQHIMADCSQFIKIVCEYINYNLLNTVSPATTIKPLTPINTPTGCDLSGAVKTSSGVYIKSFCADIYGRNYDNSRKNCLIKEMKLYQMDSEEAKSAVLAAADERWFKNNTIARYYVSGKNDSGCLTIYDYEPFAPFRPTMANCSYSYRSLCEYLDLTLVTTTVQTTTTTVQTTTTTTLAPTTVKIECPPCIFSVASMFIVDWKKTITTYPSNPGLNGFCPAPKIFKKYTFGPQCCCYLKETQVIWNNNI